MRSGQFTWVTPEQSGSMLCCRSSNPTPLCAGPKCMAWVHEVREIQSEPRPVTGTIRGLMPLPPLYQRTGKGRCGLVRA